LVGIFNDGDEDSNFDGFDDVDNGDGVRFNRDLGS
jgi:hypothetical protein